MKLTEGTMLNSDTRMRKNIEKQIKRNNGFCPLKPEKNADTKCPCKEYRETGFCECGLYVKDISALTEQMFAGM